MSALDIAVVAGGAAASGAVVRWAGSAGPGTAVRAAARTERLRAEGAAPVHPSGSGDTC